MKDQYLKAHDILDSENTRFWIRFNIFTGLQFIVFAGLAANYEELSNQKVIGCLIIFAALVFSAFTILIILRSLQVTMGMYKAIQELENNDQSFILLKTYKKYSKSPLGCIAQSCLVMSSLLTVFWIVFLILFIKK